MCIYAMAGCFPLERKLLSDIQLKDENHGLSEGLLWSCSDSLEKQETEGRQWLFQFVQVHLFWRELANACFCIGNRDR